MGVILTVFIKSAKSVYFKAGLHDIREEKDSRLTRLSLSLCNQLT